MAGGAQVSTQLSGTASLRPLPLGPWLPVDGRSVWFTCWPGLSERDFELCADLQAQPAQQRPAMDEPYLPRRLAGRRHIARSQHLDAGPGALLSRVLRFLASDSKPLMGRVPFGTAVKRKPGDIRRAVRILVLARHAGSLIGPIQP